MTIAFWCVFSAILLPYVWTIVAKAGPTPYDNNSPREFCEAQTGYRQRAYWAAQNSFESLPVFAAAVIIAYLVGVIAPATLNCLALAFIACRILHGILYLLDWASLRTFIWLIAQGCIVAMFVLSA